MRRREIIAAMGGVIGWPIVALAQRGRPGGPSRIMTLPDLHPNLRTVFSAAMLDLGWIEERDFLVIQSGFAFGDESQRDEWARLVLDLKPDVVVVQSSATALALHRATSTTPIVMIFSGYPVEAGVANSLARPGRNVTGNTSYAEAQFWGKLVELLHDVRPNIKRVSVLWSYVPPKFPREEIEPCYVELRTAERQLGLTLQIVEAAYAQQVRSVLNEIEGHQPDALIVTWGTPPTERELVTRFAVKNTLPTITDGRWPPNVEPWPLLSYGAVGREQSRGIAVAIDKILRGTRPGDIPIQRPARFELVINLKTAKLLGITVPPELLVRADEVIE